MSTVEERVRELLATTYLPEGVDIYMASPNRNLGMKTPTELIAAGRGEAVLAEVKYLTGDAW
jgi:hypothetical protein